MERIFKQPVQCKLSKDRREQAEKHFSFLGYECRAISKSPITTTWYTRWQGANNRVTNTVALINANDRYVVPDGNLDFFMAVAAMSEGNQFFPWEYVWDLKRDRLYKIRKIQDGMAFLTDEYDTPCRRLTKATLEEIEEYFTKDIVNVEAIDNQLPGFGEIIQVWNDASPQRFNRHYIGINRNGKIVTVSDNPNEFFEARNAELNFFDHWAKFGANIEVSFQQAREYLAEHVFGTGTFPEQIKFK
jgi:hypothetical protein